MKVAILAGGLGTRLSEETITKPKPMVEIGGRPILWHIMKYYSSYGFNEFIVALGYKGEIIKDYFVNYYLRESDLTVNLCTGDVKSHTKTREDWTIHLIDTGYTTQTGGRIKRVAEYIQEPFMLTYGDGVSSVNITELVNFHRREGRIATVTAVRPPARFGAIHFEGNLVSTFDEKPQLGEGWINGGFFVFEPAIVNYISGDESVFELGPMEKLTDDHQLSAYRHDEFWYCMDTLRDVRTLEKLWQDGDAPWKIWKDK